MRPDTRARITAVQGLIGHQPVVMVMMLPVVVMWNKVRIEAASRLLRDLLHEAGIEHVVKVQVCFDESETLDVLVWFDSAALPTIGAMPHRVEGVVERWITDWRV